MASLLLLRLSHVHGHGAPPPPPGAGGRADPADREGTGKAPSTSVHTRATASPGDTGSPQMGTLPWHSSHGSHCRQESPRGFQ